MEGAKPWPEHMAPQQENKDFRAQCLCACCPSGWSPKHRPGLAGLQNDCGRTPGRGRNRD